MFVYNRLAAVNYARKWALGRNPQFPNYGGGGGGGDCSNFISQCLNAGGWPMVDGWNRDKFAWWAEKDETSRTWSSAQWFGGYIGGSGIAKPCERDQLVLGDIVTIVLNEHIDHAMMITQVKYLPSGRAPLYCGHSTDRLDYPLAAAELEQSGRGIIYWKVADISNGQRKMLDNAAVVLTTPLGLL